MKVLVRSQSWFPASSTWSFYLPEDHCPPFCLAVGAPQVFAFVAVGADQVLPKGYFEFMEAGAAPVGKVSRVPGNEQKHTSTTDEDEPQHEPQRPSQWNQQYRSGDQGRDIYEDIDGGSNPVASGYLRLRPHFASVCLAFFSDSA